MINEVLYATHYNAAVKTTDQHCTKTTEVNTLSELHGTVA